MLSLPVHRRLVWDLLRDTDPYYLNHQVVLVDFATVDGVRERLAAAGQPKPSYVAFVLYAMTRVLPRYPVFNSYLREFPWVRLARYRGIDIAYTVEKTGPDGSPLLTLSVLRACGDCRFDEFVRRLEGQKNQSLDELGYTRTRRLFAAIPNVLRMPLFRLCCKPFPAVMRSIAGTVGFTSVGKHGVDFTTPLSPKSMTVSLGAVRPRPMVVGGAVVPRQSAYVTFTYDHRVADGRDCAAFGDEVRRWLEVGCGEPERDA